VRYATATSFRQALDDRLKAESASTGLGITRLRKRVAFELFLRRLVLVGGDQWILKGALALEFRLSTGTRSTKDIDIESSSDEHAVIEQLTAAQSVSLDDFFTYTLSRTDALDNVDDFSAVRFSVTAELGGRTFERFVLDVAFRDATPLPPDSVTTSRFLSFAEIEPVVVPAVAIEQHIAEKVHAYTRTYGPGARPSTRPKDLVDILLIAGDSVVGAHQLRRALERTFATRGVHVLPAALPAPPPEWAQPYRRLAREVGVESELEPAHALAAGFLDPALASAAHGEWHPATARWWSDS
jgi:predicted nucleotidyltransferase component of viral defense system